MVDAAAPRRMDGKAAGPRYLVNVAAQGMGRFAFIGSTVIVWVLAARLLGADAFGRFAYVMAFVAIVGTVADAGTSAVLGRDLAARRHDSSAADYFGNFLALRIGLGLLAGLLAAAVVPLLEPHDRGTLFVAAALAPIGTARFFDPVFQVFGRPWRAASLALWTSGLYLGLSLLALALVDDPILALVGVYGLAGIVHILLALYLGRDLVVPRIGFDLSMQRAILLLAVPIGIGGFATALNARAGVFLLAHFQSAAAVADFVAATKLVELSAVVAVTLASPLLPIFVGAMTRPGGLARAGVTVLQTLAVVTLPVAMIVWLVIPEILVRLYGPGYEAAGDIARVLVIQIAIIPFSLVISGLLIACGTTHPAYWNAFVAMGINAVISALLVPSLSGMGSAIASVAAEISMVTVAAWYVRRAVGPVVVGRDWAVVGALNALLMLAIAVPLIDQPVANGALALLAYGGLCIVLGVVPVRECAALFGRAGGHPGADIANLKPR